jgi:hypothetical protein
MALHEFKAITVMYRAMWHANWHTNWMYLWRDSMK